MSEHKNNSMKYFKPTMRVRIGIEVIPGQLRLDRLGEFIINIPEEVAENLQALPRDREIMEEMSTSHPLAWKYHERYKEIAKKREEAISLLSGVIQNEVTKIIENQDTINGYEQDKR